MTFEEKYGKISKKLIKADITKFTENFAIQITMDDEDCGGTFFVANMDGTYMVEPYDYVDNTVNINIMAATLEKLVDKKLTVDEAFEADMIVANGNTDHVVMLFDGFEKKVRKAPAKKAAPKAEEKAAPKKTTKKTVEKKATAKKETEKVAAKAEPKKEESKNEETKKPAAKKEPVKKAEPKPKKK